MNDLELAKKLISFKSTTTNADECLNTLNFIKEYLDGLDSEILNFNGHYCLFTRNCGSYDFDVILNGHIDVVPCKESQFSPFEKDAYLFGRGAIDMKSQVAVLVNLMKNVKDKKMALILTSDEEIGGFNGTIKVLEKYNPTAKVAIVPDGGYNFQLINEERGVLQLDVFAKGKSVHSSIADQGINAITLACDCYNEIKSMLENQNPNGQTVNLASINCPNDVYNKVPDNADIKIDIRYNSECDIDLVFKYLNSTTCFEYKIYAQADPFYVDTTKNIVKDFISVAEKVLNRKIEITQCPSASDARFFNKFNIPVIMMNPNGKEMHGENECLEISSLNKFKEIIEKFIENV